MITGFVTPEAAPWRQCHAATVASTPDGLVVAFFAGTAEGTADNAIYLVHGRVGAWAAPVPISEAGEAHWNPVLADGPDGGLWLFYKAGTAISQWRTLVRRSDDHGRTWSAEHELVAGDRGGRGPVKNPPVVLANRRWVAGGSVESGGDNPRWDAFADTSDDDGGTWIRRDIPVDHDALPGAGMIQPTIWYDGERVTALCRTTGGRAWRSCSDDGGSSWSAAQPTDLPNNNSGLCAARLPDGQVVAVHNESSEPWGPRNVLRWSISSDDGRTWQPGSVVDSLPEAAETILGVDSGVVTTGAGELSYPTVILDGDHLVVVYTWQRARIAFATIPIPGPVLSRTRTERLMP